MKSKMLVCFVTAAALASGQSVSNVLNFDCQAPGPVPALGGPGDCEGLTGAFAFIETAPGCAGMPSNGAGCAVVRPNGTATYLAGMPDGAVIARPLAANFPELRIPLATGTTIVGFDWRAHLSDSGVYNDGYDVSVCDAAGNRLELVLRGDANAVGQNVCVGYGGLLQTLSAPTPAGAYLSVCAYDEEDGCCGGTYFAIDRVRFSVGNDECLSAMPISGPVYGQCNYTATDSPGAACGNIKADMWYAYTAPCGGAHEFSTLGNADFDTVIAVYSACDGALLVCNDDYASGTFQSKVTVNLAAGQSAYVRVGGFNGSVGCFNLIITWSFSLGYSSPQPGTLGICITGGTPNSVFFAPATVTPGNFPNGSFFGIDISLVDLLAQIGAGAPFLGVTDGAGNAQFGPYGPGLSGLTVYGVALDDVGNPGFSVSAPASFTVP